MIDLNVGDVFDGRYRIDGVLGKGGFANVFLAADLDTNQTVALKILTRERGGYDRETTLRFERETGVLESLAHPHIVDVLRHGLSADGTLYIAFEHLPGQDLTELLQERGALDPDTAVHVLSQLLDALRHAHDAGLLHRDIKPGNVRIYKKGNDPTWVKLLDFGTARATDDGSPKISATGDIIGTPRYMSPEQLYSQPLSPASDIYSLGLLALEMLLGGDAIQGNRLGDQVDRVRADFVFPVATVAHYGSGLLQIIARMTSVEVEDRYQSASAVISAINSIERDPTRDEGPRQEAAPRSLGTAERSRGRHWAIMPGLAAVAVGLIAAYFIWSPDEAPQRAAIRENPLATRDDEIHHEMRVRDVGSEVSTLGTNVGLTTGREGCSRRPPFTSHGTLRLLNRLVAAYIPTTYDPEVAYPVVLLLHDKLQAPSSWLETSGFAELAEREGFLLLAPDGQMVNTWSHNRKDVEQLLAMLEFAAFDLCVDPSRVFVVGQGNGGSPAYRLACEDRVAAVAVSGYLRGTESFKCKMGVAVGPKPFLLLAPDNDASAPLAGGKNCYGSDKLSLVQERRLWRERNRCTGAPRKQTLAHGSCSTWECEAALTICEIDGGHHWPGSPELPLAMQCEHGSTRFDSAAQTWQFFAKLRGTPDPASPSR